jgi:hypothetical protein
MDLPSKQQALDLIRNAKYIGVAIPRDADLDKYAAMNILGNALRKSLEKDVALIFSDAVPDKWKIFNPENQVPALKKDIVVSLNSTTDKIEEIRYEKKEDGLEIIISPKDGSLGKETATIEERDRPFDLLISIGAAKLEKIAELFEKNPHAFFSIPLINIDREKTNENFGEINIIAADSSSNSEIILNLIKTLSPSPIDPQTATLALAGIMTKIKNLKETAVSPDTLLLISELKSRGADEKLINHGLAEARPLHLLKLWARALVRSKKEGSPEIFWSFITAEDFEKTGAAPADLDFVLNRFEEHFPLPNLSVFLWQDPVVKKIKALLRIESEEMLKRIGNKINGEIKNGLFIKSKENFADFREAETKVNELLRGSF